MKSRFGFSVFLVVILVTGLATPLAVAQRPEEIQVAPVRPAAAPQADCTWVELLVEDFEEWPPTGWTIVDYGDGGGCVWESTATTGRANGTGGAGYAADADSQWCGSGTSMNTGLRTPPLDLSNALTATLEYKATYFHVGGHSAAVNFYQSGAWTNLLTWSESHPAESVTLDLPVGDPDALVEFRYLAPTSHKWYMVDEVVIAACVVELPEFPVIVVEPLALNAELCAGEGVTIDLSICNQGGPPLEWQVAITETLALVDWLSVDPITGTVPAGECQEVGVTLDATGMDPGDYLADLLITSNDPDTPEVIVPVTMTVLAPAEIVAVTYEIDGLTVAFTSQVVGSGLIDYLWDLGDGSTATDPNPEHTYAAGGWYTVTLAVENACGEDEWTGMIYLAEACEPVDGVDFEWSPEVGIVGEAIQFTALEPITGTAPFTYSWTFGDGAEDDGMEVSHVYGAAGVYTVTLWVQNGCGDATVEYPVTIVEPVCVPVDGVDFEWSPEVGIVGAPIAFTALEPITGTAPFTYTWDFGDEGTGIGMTVSHAYVAPGVYTVKLKVENGCGEVTVEYLVTVEEGIGRIFIPILVKNF